MSRKRCTAEHVIGGYCGERRTRSSPKAETWIRSIGRWGLQSRSTTYYRWCKEYGGIKTAQIRNLKDLEKENIPKLQK